MTTRTDREPAAGANGADVAALTTPPTAGRRRAWRGVTGSLRGVVGACAVLAAVAAVMPARAQEAAADPLEKQRDRFRQGMDRYRAGAFEAAILVWSEIYRELGAEKGYRLAFNLARAYEQVNDPRHAAEHYDVYLAEVRKRREADETIEPVVAKQEEEAAARIAELRAELGRLRFRGAEVAVAIDADALRLSRDVAYVTAGKHVLRFRPDTREERRVEVDVAAGQIADVEAPGPDVPPPPAPAAVAAPPPPPSIRWETREEHPYSRSLLYVGAAVTAASFVLPVALYARANDYRDDYDRANGVNDDAARRAATSYEGARDTAYASWAVPALLGTATIALAAYWYFGKQTVRTPVTAGLAF